MDNSSQPDNTTKNIEKTLNNKYKDIKKTTQQFKRQILNYPEIFHMDLQNAFLKMSL